jgi:predicted AAA+ superfamily ATPase
MDTRMTKKTTQAWHNVLDLRPEITGTELSQKQFAADLHDVVLGINPGIYHDPKEFFALTYATPRLRDLVRDVLMRLAGLSEKAVRQLYLTFGGGKTHAEVTLVHLTRAPDALPDLPAVQQFKIHCGLRTGCRGRGWRPSCSITWTR